MKRTWIQKHPSLQAKQGETTVPWRSRKVWNRRWAPRPLRSPSVGLSPRDPIHQHLSALVSSEAVGCELRRGPWAWCRFSPLTLPTHPDPQLPETQPTPEHPASLSPSWPGGSPRGPEAPRGLWTPDFHWLFRRLLWVRSPLCPRGTMRRSCRPASWAGGECPVQRLWKLQGMCDAGGSHSSQPGPKGPSGSLASPSWPGLANLVTETSSRTFCPRGWGGGKLSSGGPNTGSRCRAGGGLWGGQSKEVPRGGASWGLGGGLLSFSTWGGEAGGHFSSPSHHGWLRAGHLWPSFSVAGEENKHRCSPGKASQGGAWWPWSCWRAALCAWVPSGGRQASEKGPPPQTHCLGNPGQGSPAGQRTAVRPRGSPPALGGSSWKGISLQGPEAWTPGR